MNGFVSTPAPPASPQGSVVAADGWFPDVDVSAIRAAVRIGDGVCTHQRLVAAIEGAMLTAFRALSDWRTTQALAGAASLETMTNIDAVTGAPKTINDKPEAVLIWERIIRSFTAADVYDLHKDISATDQGNIRAEDKADTADDLRRHGHNAIADMLSINAAKRVQRNMVELI